MRRLQIPQKFVCEIFHVHETAAVNLSKRLKNAYWKTQRKPVNLTTDWIINNWT